MRLVERIPEIEREPLKRNDLADETLQRFLSLEIEDALSASAGQQDGWREWIRQYRGIPKTKYSNDPIPVRNLEITLGAIACDSLYASAHDMIFGQSPLMTVRGNDIYAEPGKYFQDLVNHLALDPFTDLRGAGSNAMLDTVQMGTGVYYTQWCEHRKKTGIEKIVDRGPRIFAPPPEDIIVPGASSPDVQTLRLVAYRKYITEGELQLQAAANKWDITDVKPCGGVNATRKRREELAYTREPTQANVRYYEILDIFVYFDYDGDGFDEDLLVTWDRTSKKVLSVHYNPYDVRPFSINRYQHQPHSFFGIGVMEMISPFQTEITDWHNFRMANARLVNSRAWGVKIGSPLAGDKLRIVPNRPLYFNSPDDLKEFKMADVYPSALQYEQQSITMAEQRAGTMTNFSARPMPGHRTPGMTMLTIMQQINKRFAPAFDEMRRGLSESVQQAVFRIQERYNMGGEDAAWIERAVSKIVGPEGAEQIFRVFREPAQNLHDRISIEMTASTQSINREADKQSQLQLVQVLGNYYEKMIQLAMMAGNPQTPPNVKGLCEKVAKSATETMDRFLRTFDQVRDPEVLLISEEEFGALGSSPAGPGGPGGISGSPEGAEENLSPEPGAGEQPGGGVEMAGEDSGLV